MRDKNEILNVLAERVLFIPDAKLGVLEASVLDMYASPSTKRARQLEFNSISLVLRRLHLIPGGCKVIGLSLGCLDSGTQGLFITFNLPTVAEVEVPQAGNFAQERKEAQNGTVD